MIVYGIDPASRSLGVIGCGGRKPWSLKAATAKGSRDLELRDLRDQLSQMFDVLPPGVVFVEEPVLAGARNIRSTILIAETVGMLLTLPCRVYLVEISTWKKLTVGKGNASKEDVSSWLSSEHPDYAAICEGDQDLIDAGAINVYGREIMGSLGQFRLQRA